MLDYNASDLYLTVGVPPTWRTETLIRAQAAPLTEADVINYISQMASPQEIERFENTHELNISHSDEHLNRFRVNCFFQQKQRGVVIRHIKKKIPTIEELHLPDIYKDAILTKRGLILVVGQSGSGKSTSIAAMLDHLNRSTNSHVITVEDPVEFLHESKSCIFTQREIGIDTDSWHDALKNAMRQRPDVIYIGEIRDAETMMHAMNYAETGHLCIATLHATSASQAVERVANFFPQELRSQNLYSFAHVLKYIFAQRLVNGVKTSRELSIEILKNVGLIKPLLLKGAVPEIQDLLFRNNDIGMMTFEQSLLKLYDKRLISRVTAIEEADNPANMELELMRRRVKAEQNGESEDGVIDNFSEEENRVSKPVTHYKIEL